MSHQKNVEIFMKNQFLNLLSDSYDIKIINLDEKSLSFNFIYTFGFLKEYNIYDINEHLYSYKSAFGNLGFNFNNTTKNQIFVNNKAVYIDVAQIEKLDLNKVFYNNAYGKYIGLLIGDNPHKIEEIYEKIEQYIVRFFLDNYLAYDMNHFDLFRKFLDDFLDLNLHYILRVESLEGGILSYIICKKSSCNHKFIKNNDIFRIPFVQPYSDFVK